MDFTDTQVHTQAEIEDADFRQVANPTSVLVLPTNFTHGEAIQFLSNTIPTNDYGLPLYYIRSDMVDWTKAETYGHLNYDDLEAASELLLYDDGYPTFKSGSPFWAQMKHEPFQSHLLFKAFLDLAELEGIRLLDTLSQQENVPLENLRDLALEYYWSVRAKAYDLFIVAAEAKKREVRTRKTENTHFNVAGGILDSIIARINSEPDLIKEMAVGDLFDTMERMIKVQRLSLGLTGANSSTNPALPMTPGASVEVVMRTLTKNVGLSDAAHDNFQERMKLLMSDEPTALLAQELVIRATTGNLVYDGQKTLGPQGG